MIPINLTAQNAQVFGPDEENSPSANGSAMPASIAMPVSVADVELAVEAVRPKKSIEILSLPISTIGIDESTQSRVALHEETVAEYAEALRVGTDLPAVVVFKNDASSDLWLADGFHRLAAHQKVGATKIECEVRSGTKRDAILHSVGANAAHGLRRTNADKRRAITILLNDPEWHQWSDNQIAKACCVSNYLVADTRASLTSFSPSDTTAERTYLTKHGTVATMNTANIGKAKVVAQAPDQQVETPQASEAAGPVVAMSEDPEGNLETVEDAAIKRKKKAQSDHVIDSDELDALHLKVAALTEENAVLRADQKEMTDEVEMMDRVFTADDRIKASMEEAKRQKAIADNALRTLNVKNRDFTERAKQVIYWKNRATKAEKKLAQLQVSA